MKRVFEYVWGKNFLKKPKLIVNQRCSPHVVYGMREISATNIPYSASSITGYKEFADYLQGSVILRLVKGVT